VLTLTSNADQHIFKFGGSRVKSRAGLYGPKFGNIYDPKSAIMQSLQINDHLFQSQVA